MQGVARNFFTLAVVYAILGMLLGLSMAASQDHSHMPAHAHIMLVGWVTSAIMAFFYQLVPAASASRLAPAHFWVAAVSGIVFMASLYMLMGGNTGVEPVVGVSSTIYFASLLLFAWIALSVLWKADRPAAVSRDGAAA
jgi:cbb3-type cytochrome oxidase subunit 1